MEKTIAAVRTAESISTEVLEQFGFARETLNQLKSDLLRQVDLFQFFSEDTLGEMVHDFDEQFIKEDEVLFNEGDKAGKMFIILKGELGIFKLKKRIAIRRSGEYIGEMALIESKDRSGTARALADTMLLGVEEKFFKKYLLSESGAVAAMMKTLSHRIRDDMEEMANEMLKLNTFTHDMRNCLVPLGKLEFLLDELNETLRGTKEHHKPRMGWEMVQSCYEVMANVRNNLITLIDQSLACAKKIKSEYIKEKGPLVPLLTETVNEISCYKHLKTKDIQIRSAGEIKDCLFNSLDIKRVLQNLLINASHVTDEGGVIEVLVQDLGEEVQVTVKDYGTGIPDDIRPHLLREPFTSRPDGNGFGLMSCKELIEKYHQGRIWFDSIWGEGASFHFTLPYGNA